MLSQRPPPPEVLTLLAHGFAGTASPRGPPPWRRDQRRCRRSLSASMRPGFQRIASRSPGRGCSGTSRRPYSCRAPSPRASSGRCRRGPPAPGPPAPRTRGETSQTSARAARAGGRRRQRGAASGQSVARRPTESVAVARLSASVPLPVCWCQGLTGTDHQSRRRSVS